jgi:hypothetical protein
MPVAQLLQELGLQQFEAAFKREWVSTVDVLHMMGGQDYKDLGIPVGPMLMIMARCKQLMQPAY